MGWRILGLGQYSISSRSSVSWSKCRKRKYLIQRRKNCVGFRIPIMIIIKGGIFQRR
jgi:hypothetical protein